jgi:hypothetical protein
MTKERTNPLSSSWPFSCLLPGCHHWEHQDWFSFAFGLLLPTRGSSLLVPCLRQLVHCQFIRINVTESGT